jgi:uncharacterized protein (TIGR02444 family)
VTDSFSPEDEFWDFAVRTYGIAGVGERLLDWQDGRGANVNLVLLCLWAAERGRRLDPAACARAFAAASGWHTAAVEPLRALRRRLKVEWAGLAQDVRPTRSAVLAAELKAERAEQGLMLAALAPWPAEAGADPGQALARINLLAYLGSAAEADIDALLAAIG